jgi:hypothetical protein
MTLKLTDRTISKDRPRTLAFQHFRILFSRRSARFSNNMEKMLTVDWLKPPEPVNGVQHQTPSESIDDFVPPLPVQLRQVRSGISFTSCRDIRKGRGQGKAKVCRTRNAACWRHVVPLMKLTMSRSIYRYRQTERIRKRRRQPKMDFLTCPSLR